MLNSDKSMRERGLNPDRGKEIFLQVAAYRATHEGRQPPENSELWMEHVRFWKQNHPRPALARWFVPDGPEFRRRKTKPLAKFPLDRIFLTDDFRMEMVDARLRVWPMVLRHDYTCRDISGEWFRCAIVILAETRRQAERILNYIFSI